MSVRRPYGCAQCLCLNNAIYPYYVSKIHGEASAFPRRFGAQQHKDLVFVYNVANVYKYCIINVYEIRVGQRKEQVQL